MIAAIYTRKSTEQSGVADEQKSVTRQIDHARQYAARKGWTVADEYVYVDDGISGAEFANRPGFLRLMNALKPRAPFQVLVMSEESRLGREAIETAYALKQLVTAGVRVFFYLEDRERTLDSPTDKVMLSLTAFADELEREKARQRTYDAMQRKAKAGDVTGGRVFGYDNVRLAVGGVRRHINEPEAVIVRRIFDLCARGFGMKQITSRLNEAGAVSPRPQQGRPAGWAPSSVRSILHRPLYRGEIVWNRSRKRDGWGQTKAKARPESEWMRIPVPEMRIVSDDQWTAAHTRLEQSRALYLRGTGGRLWGQPARGTESKYLLTGLATCGVCGAGLSVRSRHHGRKRAFYYVCTAFHTRGRAVCPSSYELPMLATDAEVLDAFSKQVLSADLIQAAIDRAADRLAAPQAQDETGALRRDVGTLDDELARLTAAVAAGGELESLTTGIKSREAKRRTLRGRLEGLEAAARIPRLDHQQIKAAIEKTVEEWRVPLTRNVPQARQVLRKMLIGRLVMTPETRADGRYGKLTGTSSLAPVIGDALRSKGVASPTGIEGLWTTLVETLPIKAA